MYPQGMLSEIQQEWENRGWDISDLDFFRMDGSEVVGDTTTGTQTTDTTDQGSETEYSLAAGFLERIPQEHRPVVEPYVKQWDAGVTRRFQELHSEFEPYKGLGSVEDLQAAKQIYDLLESDPKQVFEALSQIFGEESEQGQQGTSTDGLNIEGLPPEVSQAITLMQQQQQTQQEALLAIAEKLLGQDQSTQEQREDTELEEYVNLLKQEYGEFDEDYVLAKMMVNVSAEDAIKEYQKLTGGGGQQQQTPLIPILSGGGVVPGETQNLLDLSKDQRKHLVAELLLAGNSS